MIKTNFYQHKFYYWTILLSLMLGFIFISGLMLGSRSITPNEFIHFLTTENGEANFILSLRLNREIIALCCGGMLALGSAILQGLTRNPIVAPDLAGMTSVGCLLIVICELCWLKSSVLTILLGIIGSMLGCVLCFSLSGNHHKNNRLAVLLTGISISFAASAIMQLLILKAPQNINDSLYFLTGSLYGVTHHLASLILGLAILTLPLVYILSKHFSVFALDEQHCQGIGVPIKSYRLSCFLVASILIGSSLVGVGCMGFLGVVAPNLARMMVGHRPKYVFPLSFFIGGLIYLTADILGRSIIFPAEISAGIMTNMITAPLFLYVLFSYYRGQHEWN